MIATKTRPPTASNRRRKSLAVLLVEDEAIVALATRDALQELGCQVVGWATSATEAERLAAATPPDVVLMDVRLKGQLDGIDAAIRLRERHEAPIIFVTGLLQEELRERMNHASPAAILFKPYTQEDLRSALRLACGA